MGKVELEGIEEMVDKQVSRFGRIDGLKHWEGKKVKVVILSEGV